MESPPFTLGGKLTKITSFILLGGVVLLAAIPVCADSILYTASTNEPSHSESSASSIQTSHSKFTLPALAIAPSDALPQLLLSWSIAMPDASVAEDPAQSSASSSGARTFALALADPQNDARPSDSNPAMLSVNSFQLSGVSGVSSSDRSSVLGTLVPVASYPGAPSANLASSDFSTEGSRLGFFGNDPDHDRGGKGKNKNKDQGGPPVNVPEPGALPLLTLGLLAVGIIARRNRDFPANA